ncbi:MAG: hypothetical protein QM765_01515 [Myxococcales bacterium]
MVAVIELLDGRVHRRARADEDEDLAQVGDDLQLGDGRGVLRLGHDHGERLALLVVEDGDERLGLGEAHRDPVQHLGGDLHLGELLGGDVPGLEVRGEEAQQGLLADEAQLQQAVPQACLGGLLLQGQSLGERVLGDEPRVDEPLA